MKKVVVSFIYLVLLAQSQYVVYLKLKAEQGLNFCLFFINVFQFYTFVYHGVNIPSSRKSVILASSAGVICLVVVR